MTSSKVSAQEIYRRINLLSIGGNILGAFVTYFYLTALDPLPSGAASIRSPEAADNFYFAIAVAVLFVGIYLLGRNLTGPIRQWHTRIESGVPASEMPQWVARRVLNLPLISGAIIGAGWLVSAVFFANFYDNPNNLIGILIGGILTTAVVYSGTDLLWRQVLPSFFPQGNLSEVPAVRLWVRRRLMLAFTLIAITTPILLVIVTQQRTNLLETAANAQVILDNLLIVQLFILTTGLVIGFLVAGLVARAIVEPIDTLQKAMGHVEHNELDAQVQVTTNDELGYLGERFNQMTAGLREGEKLHRLFGLYVSPQVARAAVQTGAGLG
ncbi:MAG: HAMP domain-containing protein, partial [Candidatus Promineifilaceae bacterium]|nr:HAMP domain-containing protein [Candidatus Promineifilaceae bacterium]